jgi:hypothetical protein
MADPFLVKDINLGGTASTPGNLTAIGSTFYFSATNDQGYLKVCPVSPWRDYHHWLRSAGLLPSADVRETISAAVDQSAPDDLISFLKAIPDGRYRRGVRYPQWFLLLVAVLGILSGCRSSRALEAFAKRHREALNQVLDLDFKRWPSDATFLYLFNKAHLQEFGEVLQAWMISQMPGGAKDMNKLVCDGKRLGGSSIETEDDSRCFVAQVTVYAGALGVALAQKAYDTHESSERAALKELLNIMDLDGVLL